TNTSAVAPIHDRTEAENVDVAAADGTFAKSSTIDGAVVTNANLDGTLPAIRQLPHIYKQFLHLLQRQSLKLMRSINEVIFDMTLTTAVGLAIGLIYGGVWSLNGYATISTMAVLSIGVLSCVSALKMFGNDRVVFWRESSSGISETAYWLAVTLFHLPFSVVFSFLFVAPYFYLILPDTPFLNTWWIFIAIHFACSGGGMLLSICLKPIPALLSAVMIPLIVGGFLNGVSPPLSEMGQVMTGLCDISYSRYGVEALILEELQVQPEHAESVVDDLYQSIGFQPNQVTLAIGNLFVIGLVFRLFSFLALHALNRDKRM
ncbi:MAG: ABC transporter permease, partial [Candidatus Bathyarchaeia archaeon]